MWDQMPTNCAKALGQNGGGKMHLKDLIVARFPRIRSSVATLANSLPGLSHRNIVTQGGEIVTILQRDGIHWLQSV
ncbi:hypothetical protein CPB83DRAFT_848543, partial [Crepidotus variabilis]